MIGLLVTIVDYTKRVAEAAQKEKYKSLAHAAASIRKDEMASFVPSDVASKPGTPPNTRIRIVKSGKNKGKHRVGQIASATAFDVDASTAAIGPRKSIVGTSAKAHEFGGVYKQATYPERSFALPALQRNTYRFAEEWRGSITG